MTSAASRLALAALLVAAGPATGEAQRWRTLDIARQVRDSVPLDVRVSYGAGRFELRPAAQPLLYQMRLRYDVDRAAPLHDYSAPAHSLRLGVKGLGKRHGSGKEDEDDSRLGVELARGVPVDLAMELGAVEADLELGGLAVKRLRLESGASSARIRFDTLNAAVMSVLELHVGAASLTAERLANANARVLRLKAGVGSLDLDFGGQWSGDMDVQIDVALGFVRLRLPREIGVRVDLDRVIATFEHDGMASRGGAYYTENWESARRRIRIKARTVLGKLRIDRG